MSLGKELGAIVTLFLIVGSVVFYSTMLSGSVRMINGDPSAAGDIANATADEIVGTLQWSLGVWVLIAVAGALGLTGVVAWLKKYCD